MLYINDCPELSDPYKYDVPSGPPVDGIEDVTPGCGCV